MSDNESYVNKEKRRLAENQVKIDKMNVLAKEYNNLLDSGGDLLENSYDIFMEGDRIEDWEEFERHMQKAIETFRNAMKQLHLLAKISPSDVQPERYTEIEGIIDRTVNMCILYWEKWGQRLRREDIASVMAMTHWTCAALQAAGIRNDMESPEAESFCRDKCRFRETCDHEGL